MNDRVVGGGRWREHIAHGARLGVRSDGRGCEHRRGGEQAFDVEVGVLEECYGSARCVGARGDADVLCGVRLDLSRPCTNALGSVMGDVVVKVTGPGLSGTTLGAARLEDFFRALLVGGGGAGGGRKGQHGLDLAALCVLDGKLAWRVLVDVLVTSCDGCGVVDCIGIAIKCALASTSLPKVSAPTSGARQGSSVMATAFAQTGSGRTGQDQSIDFNVETEDAAEGRSGTRLDVHGVPIAVAVSKIADGLQRGEDALSASGIGSDRGGGGGGGGLAGGGKSAAAADDGRGGGGDGVCDDEDMDHTAAVNSGDDGIGEYFYYHSEEDRMRRSDYVIDATYEEELCADVVLLLGVTGSAASGTASMCEARTLGGGAAVADGSGSAGGLLLPSVFQDMIAMGTRSGAILFDAVDSFIKENNSDIETDHNDGRDAAMIPTVL